MKHVGSITAVLSVWLSICLFTGFLKNNSLVFFCFFFCYILWTKCGIKLIQLYVDKNQSFPQVDTIIFGGRGQAHAQPIKLQNISKRTRWIAFILYLFKNLKQSCSGIISNVFMNRKSALQESIRIKKTFLVSVLLENRNFLEQ